MSEYKYDVFFGEKDGWEAHIGITAETPEDLDTDRKIILGLLKDNEAKPRFGRANTGVPAVPGNVATTTSTTGTGDMVAAAKAVFPTAQIQAKCPNDGAVMRTVAAGVSARTGKPYPSFYVCGTCGHKGNSGA